MTSNIDPQEIDTIRRNAERRDASLEVAEEFLAQEELDSTPPPDRTGEYVQGMAEAGNNLVYGFIGDLGLTTSNDSRGFEKDSYFGPIHYMEDSDYAKRPVDSPSIVVNAARSRLIQENIVWLSGGVDNELRYYTGSMVFGRAIKKHVPERDLRPFLIVGSKSGRKDVDILLLPIDDDRWSEPVSAFECSVTKTVWKRLVSDRQEAPLKSTDAETTEISASYEGSMVESPKLRERAAYKKARITSKSARLLEFVKKKKLPELPVFNDETMRSFNVLEHLADIAVAFGSVDAFSERLAQYEADLETMHSLARLVLSQSE